MVEPEIWFRIVHVAVHAHNGAPAATYSEQTVEIALGPKGAFENGDDGTVTRRVAAEGLVSAVPRSRRAPKPPRQPRTPRVVALLRKAIAWRVLLESGEVDSQAEIARREGITRARVTQIMGLLRIAPEIRERILAMREILGRSGITERGLRRVVQVEEPDAQRAAFSVLARCLPSAAFSTTADSRPEATSAYEPEILACAGTTALTGPEPLTLRVPPTHHDHH